MLQALRIDPVNLDMVLTGAKRADVRTDVRNVAEGRLLLLEEPADPLEIGRAVEVNVTKVQHKTIARLNADDAASLAETFEQVKDNTKNLPSGGMITLVEFRQPKALDIVKEQFEVLKPLAAVEAFTLLSRNFSDSLARKADLLQSPAQALDLMQHDAADLLAFGAIVKSRAPEAARAAGVGSAIARLRSNFGGNRFPAVARRAEMLLSSTGVIDQPVLTI